MDSSFVTLWAWLAIWLSGLGVALGQSTLARTSMEILGKNPKLSWTLLVYTILGLALVESAVIYWLVVAFKITGSETVSAMNAISAGLAIWLTGFWAGFWEWKMLAWAMEAVNRNPENKAKVLQFMILFLALIEVVAIYWLIISFELLK